MLDVLFYLILLPSSSVVTPAIVVYLALKCLELNVELEKSEPRSEKNLELYVYVCACQHNLIRRARECHKLNYSHKDV